MAACVNPSKSSVFIPLYITCFCTQTHHHISTPTSHLIFMFYSFWLGWNLTVKAPPAPNSIHFLRTFKYFYAHATQGGGGCTRFPSRLVRNVNYERAMLIPAHKEDNPNIFIDGCSLVQRAHRWTVHTERNEKEKKRAREQTV